MTANLTRRTFVSSLAAAALIRYLPAAFGQNSQMSAKELADAARAEAAHEGDAPDQAPPLAHLSPSLKPSAVKKAMEKVANWELARSQPYFNQDWTYAALYTGFMAASAATGDNSYRDAMLAMGNKCDWKLGPRVEHADDQCIGQTYLALYSQYRDSKMIAPLRAQLDSILVLPPINETSDVTATYGMLSQMTLPLAESGYYVVPVAVMDETFKQNGLTNAAEIQQTSPAKLREIFGADAALYSKVSQYGTVYRILASATVVSASAKLVDLRTGDVLWQGRASASSDEGGNSGGGGLIGMLVTAAVKQIANTLMDQSHSVAAYTSTRMLSAGPPNGLLYGPHSPKYGTD